MRCPDCNKFVSLELQEPEFDSLEVSVTKSEERDAGPDGFVAHVTGSCRIVRNCGECGQELKEATLEIDKEIDFHRDELAVPLSDEDLGDATVETENEDQLEEGGGRYAKSYFGATAELVVTAGKGANVIELCREEWSDKVAASEMDELV